MSQARKLIEERDHPYGNSWLITGVVIDTVIDLFTDFQQKAPELLIPWMMILNKLVRLLFSPYSEDNWRDIAGYVELVLRHFETTRIDVSDELEEVNANG